MQSPSAAKTWTLAAPGAPVVGQPARIMGIINATPDSFSDGGQWSTAEAAVAAGMAMQQAGADWLDVGGESTRPGALAVAEDEEIRRVVPVIAGLQAAGCQLPISVDTRKAAVAEAAIDAGAVLINDVSGGRDPAMLRLAAQRQVAICLMHMRGEPATMQQQPEYGDVVGEVQTALQESVDQAMAAGVPADAILIDPGIGFGKTAAHNIALLHAAGSMTDAIGRPMLLGISRKRIVAHLMAEPDSAPADRDTASHLLHAQLAGQCAILRVHDVAGAKLAVRLCLGLR